MTIIKRIFLAFGKTFVFSLFHGLWEVLFYYCLLILFISVCAAKGFGTAAGLIFTLIIIVVIIKIVKGLLFNNRDGTVVVYETRRRDKLKQLLEYLKNS